VPPYLIDHWYAYLDLHGRRQTDMGYPQSIPVSEVLAYTQLHGWPDEQARELAFLVARLNNQHLELMSRQREAARGKP
jgi:hypothetical protein